MGNVVQSCTYICDKYNQDKTENNNEKSSNAIDDEDNCDDDDFLNEAAYIEETVPMPNADFSVNYAEETDSQMLVEMASDEAELYDAAPYDFDESHESKLEERMRHISDTFSQYLMYLIQEKKMENS